LAQYVLHANEGKEAGGSTTLHVSQKRGGRGNHRKRLDEKVVNVDGSRNRRRGGFSNKDAERLKKKEKKLDRKGTLPGGREKSISNRRSSV